MYSRAVTDRNNAALKRRKELIDLYKTKDFIVVYPAKILGRDKKSKDKFVPVEEF